MSLTINNNDNNDSVNNNNNTQLNFLPSELLEDLLSIYLDTCTVFTILTRLSHTFHTLVTSDSICERKLINEANSNAYINCNELYLNNLGYWNNYTNYYQLYRSLHNYINLVGHWRSENCYLGQLVCFYYSTSTQQIIGRNIQLEQTYYSKPLIVIQLNHNKITECFYLEYKRNAGGINSNYQSIQHKCTLSYINYNNIHWDINTLQSRIDSNIYKETSPPKLKAISNTYTAFQLSCDTLPQSGSLDELNVEQFPTPFQRRIQSLFYPNPPATYFRLPFPDCYDKQHNHFKCKTKSITSAEKKTSSGKQLTNHSYRNNNNNTNNSDDYYQIIRFPGLRCYSSPYPVPGLYVATYGPHGQELVAIQYIRNYMIAMKVLGDANVISGRVSFKIYLKGQERKRKQRNKNAPINTNNNNANNNHDTNGNHIGSNSSESGLDDSDVQSDISDISTEQKSQNGLRNTEQTNHINNNNNNNTMNGNHTHDNDNDSDNGSDTEDNDNDDNNDISHSPDVINANLPQSGDELLNRFLHFRNTLPRTLPEQAILLAEPGRGTIALTGFSNPQRVDITCYFHANNEFSLDFLGLIHFQPFSCPFHQPTTNSNNNNNNN